MAILNGDRHGACGDEGNGGDGSVGATTVGLVQSLVVVAAAGGGREGEVRAGGGDEEHSADEEEGHEGETHGVEVEQEEEEEEEESERKVVREK